MSLITLDLETYYNKAEKYSLENMTMLDYIADERFFIFGATVKIDDAPAEWVEGADNVFYAARTFSRYPLLGHNLRFDGLVLQYFEGIRFPYYYDTRDMARGLNPHADASLAALCKMLWPNDKTKRKGEELASFDGKRFLTREEMAVLGNYANNDGEITYEAFKAMPWYPQTELDLIDLTIKMWLNPRLRLNKERVEAHRINVVTEKEEAVAKTPYEKSTFSSGDKFAEMLKRDFNITPPRKISKTTGKPTWAFAKKDLAFINLRANHPEMDHIWQAKTLVSSTQEDSRAVRLLRAAELDNGLLRVPLAYYAAHTGRFGGTEKINLQNFKRDSELRKAIEALDDQVIVVRDQSQIEARMNATVAGQLDLILQFANREDVYSKFATRVYNRPIDRKRVIVDAHGNEVKPDFIEGFVGKICVLGLGYSMGAPTFRNTMAVGAMGGPPVYFTEAEAFNIVNTYRASNHKIVEFWSHCERFIFDMACPNTNYEWGPLRIQTGRIVLPNGMALTYPGLKQAVTASGPQWIYHGRKGWKSIYGGKLCENIIQALARIIIAANMVAIEKELDGLGHVVSQVHDEILVVGPENQAKEIDQVMAEIMNTPPSWLPDLPIDSEGGWAKQYSK